MSLNSIGDLAQTLMLRSQGTRIRMQIDTLTQELSSGQVADVAGRLRGDFSHLSDMDRSLKRLNALSTAAAETRLLADATQASLETVNQAATDLSDSLLSVSLSNQAVSHAQASVEARSALDTMVSALNTSLAGRSVFAGVAEDQAPLRSADTLLSGLRDAVAGQSTPSDILQAARDWFDDAAGFQSVVYTGSDQSRSPVQVSGNDQVALARRADDPVFREGLMLAAVAALANDPALSLDTTTRSAIFEAAGTGLLGTRDRMVELQAEVGDAQARIEKAQTGNSMARTSLELARGELIGADPYETAIRLEAVQFQLESLYTTTVRNSRLTLVNFLR